MIENGGEKYIKVTRELAYAWIVRGFLTAGIAVGGWFLARVVNTADDISHSVHSHDMSLEILKYDTKEIKEGIRDHESRLRSLERDGPPRPNGLR